MQALSIVIGNEESSSQHVSVYSAVSVRIESFITGKILSHRTTSVRERILASIDIELPKNLNGVYQSKFKKQWEDAMQAELDSQEANKVFEIVPRSSVPEGDTIVGSRWVFGVKSDVDGFVTRFKARLVAQGFSQIEGKDFDDIFAPVVALRDVVLLVALSTVMKLK